MPGERVTSLDTITDTVVVFTLQGDQYRVSPEPGQVLKFSAAFIALRKLLQQSKIDDHQFAEKLAESLRDHLLGDFRAVYDTLGPKQKEAVLLRLWEAYCDGDEEPVDPTSGPSGPIAPLALDGSTSRPSTPGPPPVSRTPSTPTLASSGSGTGSPTAPPPGANTP